MKIIKIYLAVVTFLLIVGLGFGVYAWYTIQNLSTAAGNAPLQKEVPSTPQSETASQAEVPTKEPVVVKTADLTPTQQNMLKTFGIKGDTLTITSEMIVCAEEAVGSKVRLDEILAGAAPNPLEAMKLLPCFK